MVFIHTTLNTYSSLVQLWSTNWMLLVLHAYSELISNLHWLTVSSTDADMPDEEEIFSSL